MFLLITDRCWEGEGHHIFEHHHRCGGSRVGTARKPTERIAGSFPNSETALSFIHQSLPCPFVFMSVYSGHAFRITKSQTRKQAIFTPVTSHMFVHIIITV